jgi:hypothetical protein
MRKYLCLSEVLSEREHEGKWRERSVPLFEQAPKQMHRLCGRRARRLAQRQRPLRSPAPPHLLSSFHLDARYLRSNPFSVSIFFLAH